MDEIWVVVRKDGNDIHRTSHNSRTIRAYKTEGMAKGQAKRWNKPYRVVDTHGGYDKETNKWVMGTYKMYDPGEQFIVVKYVPEQIGGSHGPALGQPTEAPTD